jgi:iron complex transport system ATP-binding protein
MNSTPFLQIDNLSFNWSKTSKLTLNNLNIQLKEHTITALIGPNGSGKSLLMQLLAGLKQGTQGKVSLYDSDIALLPPKKRACQVAYLAPHNENCPALTVQQILLSASYAQPQSINKKNYGYWLTTLQLTKLEQLLLPTLSTGQQAKVRLARTFLQGCPLILLDEPFAHVDLPQTATLWHNLKQMTQSSTIVIAEQQLSLVSHYAQHIILLSHHNEWRAGGVREYLTEENLNWAWNTQGYKIYPATDHRQSSYVGFTHITSPEVKP